MPNWKKVIISGSDAGLNSLYVTNAVTASSFQVTGGIGNEGTFTWNSTDNTVDLQLNDVTLQLGQELVYHVVNQTGTQINNGEVVYAAGVSSDKLSVAPYSASLGVSPDLVLGVVTENIPDTEFGFVTRFGTVRDVDTSGFAVGTPLYAATGSSGYTDTVPSPPDSTIFLGTVTKQDAVSGNITLKVNHLLNADEVKTNLSGSGLSSTNVEGALLELQANKVDIGALSSNIIIYPTTGSSPVSGYFRMVTDVDDPDYNTTAVDVSTGAISGSGQFIAALASDVGLFVGNPGIIAVSTIGNIRKTGGSGGAQFYYEIYLRDSGSTETLVATSDTTGVVDDPAYTEFNASAILNNGIWSATDRVVVKYYANRDPGGSNPTYDFQFGGISPVRTLLPVPVSVVPSDDAVDIQTITSNFNNILSGADTDVQKALDTLDDHSHTLQEITDEGNITTNRIIVGDLTVDTDTIYTDGSGNVGIGTSSPSYTLDITGSGRFEGNLIVTGSVIGDGSGLVDIKATETDLQQTLLTNQTVGGLNSGTTLTVGDSIESILRQILIAYIPPTFGSLLMRIGGSNISTSARDAGNSFTADTASFSATADNPDGIYPLSSSLTGSGADVGTITHYFGDDVLSSSNALSIGGSYTINVATPATAGSSVTFRVRGQRSDTGAFISDTVRSYSFRWRNYLCASSTIISDNTTAQAVINAGVVQSTLDTNRAWTATCSSANNTAGNYTYIIYPSGYGDLSGIIQDGATPVLDAFTKVGDFTISNAYGSSRTFRVYKSNADGAFSAGKILTIS
jgi:hypothetical protein